MPCPLFALASAGGEGQKRRMSRAELHIDHGAIAENWRALDRASAQGVETAAVVKADAYGLGAAEVARRLLALGVRRFFVALAEEGADLRRALGEGPEICVFSGHMEGDAPLIREARLVPMLNAPEQIARHRAALAGHPYGIQLDTGMNRLGIEPDDWAAARADLPAPGPGIVMSHLACADEPDHEMNARQLARFREMSVGIAGKRSLSATGGILLGPDYHFDITRPGIGLYGGAPFAEARPVVRLSLPVIQIRTLAPGETVGYGNSWQAARPSRIATLGAGYADGLLRALSNRAQLYAGATPCPIVGRVSMDLITADITDLAEAPETLDILGPHQGIDALAEAADTIGYEILTALGQRYARRHLPAAPAPTGPRA